MATTSTTLLCASWVWISPPDRIRSPAGDSPWPPGEATALLPPKTAPAAAAAAPVWRSRRREVPRCSDSLIEPSLSMVVPEIAGVVDDLAADDRENGLQPRQVGVADRAVVAVEHDKVAELAGLDRAELVLHVEEPGVFPRVQANRLVPGDLLPDVDDVAESVLTGARVVHAEPRVQRRDVHAVEVDAGLDAVVEDRTERGAGGRTGARHVAEGAALHGPADRLQPVEERGGHDRDVVDAPAQVLDAELGVHGLVPGDLGLERGQAEGPVVVAPLGRGDELLGLEPDRTDPVARGAPLADRAGHHEVVAEELKLVEQTLGQLGQVDVVLVVQKVGLQADE